MNSEIAGILHNIYPLPNKETELMLSLFKFRQIQKSEVFAAENNRNISEYIVFKGVCRSFVTDTEGKEATLSFFTEGQVLPPNQSRTVNDISFINLQALTDLSIWEFPRNPFYELMTEYRELEKWGRVVYDNELKNKVQKELSLITMPAKERLSKFRKQWPRLENRIPLPYIASYLGISPVSLSRLRNQFK